jgi:TP53 regulating kinase-like protein
MKQIAQGAEAIIYQDKNKVVKERIPKTYRLPELDLKLRRRRTKSEAKILDKLQGIIPVPKILSTPKPQLASMIHMQFIDGKKLSDHLENLDWKSILKQLAEILTKLHDQDLIHGDLTTSNMILKDNKVYLIDFGLGFHSHKIEDKAVDLHLLKQALDAKHFSIFPEAFNIILKNYKAKQADLIIQRIDVIEKRGRYRH